MTSNPGVFITLEGIEGAGKSTHAVFLQQLLEKNNKKCLVTREPGGTALGEAVRNILLKKNDLSILPVTELLLMFSARAQHIESVIKPALAEGKIVICDRFTDSSYAYQGGGRGVAKSIIDQLVEVVHADITPDLTLLFDLSPEVGLKRARGEGGGDRFESETIDFFERARNVFLDRAEQDRTRIHVIDAELEISQIQNDIQSILQTMKLC